MTTTPSTNSKPQPAEPTPALWIGLDWGDRQHSFALLDASGHREEGTLEHTPETLHAWLKGLEQRTGGRPVRLALETSRGAVVAVLLEYPWLEIYPINPVTSANFRKAFAPSGAKDDLPDARVLLDLLTHHADKLRPLQVQDAPTQKLAALVEARRGLVDRRTALLNQLTSLLKGYFPQALVLLGSLNTDLAIAWLRRWPDLLALKTAKPATLKRFYYQHQVRSDELIQERLELVARAQSLTTDQDRIAVAVLQLHPLLDQLEVLRRHVEVFNDEIKAAFAAHPEAGLFQELPGAGPQLAPRLCVAFGTVRPLYPDPDSVQKYMGVAPVREKSGNQCWTHWRWQAPKFLRQTFVEWAGQTVRYSAWAGKYYEAMEKKGKKHAVILRALAFKWIRILWRCWQDRTPYDEARYLRQLQHRKSPYAIITTIEKS